MHCRITNNAYFMSKAEEIKKILKENDRRNAANNAIFNPITGGISKIDKD